MKKTLPFFVTVVLALTALFLQTQISMMADDNQCEKNFGLAVAQCAQSLRSLSPSERPGAQKACVGQAKIAKAACLSAINLCLNNCQAIYDINVIACEQLPLQDQPDCLSSVLNVLMACRASCTP